MKKSKQPTQGEAEQHTPHVERRMGGDEELFESSDAYKTLRRLAESKQELSDETAIRLATVQKELAELKLQRERFEWERAGRTEESLQKWFTGLAATLAALLVAWWGKGVVEDMKPVHLETGTVSSIAKDGNCIGSICSNTIRVSLLQQESPIDAAGNRCRVRDGVKPRKDRSSEIGEPYYLSSDFITDLAADSRCFRAVSIHVPARFSRTPIVTSQISWLDALSADSTIDGAPILESVPSANGPVFVPRSLNTRIEALVSNVSRNGFDIVIRTWFDSRIYRADVTYTAFIQ
jgi:hypothetical protein